MVMNAKTIKKLKAGKAERGAFVSSQINVGIPFQIRALRKQRGWDQKTLADKSGMAQPRISAIEKVGGASLNLETLKRLAAAFDIGLVVRFAPFGELVSWSGSFSPDEFEVSSFEDDVILTESLALTAPVSRLIRIWNCPPSSSTIANESRIPPRTTASITTPYREVPKQALALAA